MQEPKFEPRTDDSFTLKSEFYALHNLKNIYV